MSQQVTLDLLIQRFFDYALKNLRFILFIAVLGLIHIINNHFAHSLITDINKKANQLKELRWDYLTIKSDLMYRSKLTEVLPRAEEMGLHKMTTAPSKLTIKEKDYQRQD
jgi:hypothetical protein